MEKIEVTIEARPDGVIVARVEAGSTVEPSPNGRYLLVTPPGKEPYVIDLMTRVSPAAVATVTIEYDELPLEGEGG